MFKAIMCSDFCRAGRIIPSNRYHLFTAEADSHENPPQMENPVQPDPTTAVTGIKGDQTDATRREQLMAKAKSLEAAFLSEMLSHAGLEASEGPFSGGIGEDQFASFLREAQAKSIVEHGGIGLAEHLFQSLVKKDHAAE
jgi:peptidoglycan hydrolase FlgJ